MLRWTVTGREGGTVLTTRSVLPSYPARDATSGTLADDKEARFRLPEGNPLADFGAVHRIRLRVKDGRLLLPR